MAHGKSLPRGSLGFPLPMRPLREGERKGGRGKPDLNWFVTRSLDSFNFSPAMREKKREKNGNRLPEGFSVWKKARTNPL